jgi:DNA-binding MarR family transcriptional regulator
MEAAGMIKKEKDALDKRTSRVSMTLKGKEAYKQVAEIWRTMETVTIEGFTIEEENLLKGLLQKVLVNLR